MAVLRNIVNVSGATKTLVKLVKMTAARSNGSVPGGRTLATTMVVSGRMTSTPRTSSAAMGAVNLTFVQRSQFSRPCPSDNGAEAPRASAISIHLPRSEHLTGSRRSAGQGPIYHELTAMSG